MPTTLPHANDSVPPTVARLAAVSTIARSQRQRAAQLLREHGSDTLSAFKLRQDLQQRFHAHGRAVVAQRAVSGVLLLAGDPVCAPADLPMALNAARLEARSRGLALGAVGASQACRDAACELGLRSLYLGDEALLPTGVMNLSGNAHRSLRKAVNRVARGGYTAELLRCGDLDERMLGQLTDVSDAWLDGTAERGFSMTHDRIDDELLPDALVIVARDESGRVRGFLHFVPVFGRPVVSLAFMRRERDTPKASSTSSSCAPPNCWPPKASASSP